MKGTLRRPCPRYHTFSLSSHCWISSLMKRRYWNRLPTSTSKFLLISVPVNQFFQFLKACSSVGIALCKDRYTVKRSIRVPALRFLMHLSTSFRESNRPACPLASTSSINFWMWRIFLFSLELTSYYCRRGRRVSLWIGTKTRTLQCIYCMKNLDLDDLGPLYPNARLRPPSSNANTCCGDWDWRMRNLKLTATSGISAMSLAIKWEDMGCQNGTVAVI